jgi:hypothetical protein
MIERNYSKYIADHADELARATLPRPTEVVSIDERRASTSGEEASDTVPAKPQRARRCL